MTEKLPKKTYNFKAKFNVVNGAGEAVSSKELKIKVTVGNAKAPVVTVKAKGSIDLADRNGSCILYTPTVKNLSGIISAVTLSGKDSEMFSAEWDAGRNAAVVRAKEDAQLKLKTKYQIRLAYTVKLGNGSKVLQEEKAYTIIPKQSKLGIRTADSVLECHLAQPGYTAKSWLIISKPAGAELTGVSPAGEEEHFNCTYVKASGKEAGTIQVNILDTCGLQSGKTYTITLALAVKGEAVGAKRQNMKVKVRAG